MFWKLMLLLFVVWLIYRRWKLRKLIRTYNVVKSDTTSIPFLGHAHYFIGDDERQMSGWCRFGREAIRNGGLSSFWTGDYLFVNVADPEIIEFVSKTCMEKGEIMRFVRYVIGNGSIMAPVIIWRPRRKILAPTFSQKNLNQFVNVFAQQSAVMVEKFGKRGGEAFSIWDYITTYTMDSVCETTLGVQLKVQDDPNHPFLKAFEEGTKLIATRLISPWQHNDAVYKLLPSGRRLTKIKQIIENFINEVIQKKRKENKTTNRENLDVDKNKAQKEPALQSFLDLLIEASGSDGGKGYSDLELMEETMVLLMAGTDTSAVGSCFTALMLARHQDVQEKVYQEIKELYGDSRPPVVAEDLPKMKYLDMVIKETLRLYPPVPVTVRNADNDVTLPNGVVLGEGSTILFHIWAMHRSPRYWGPDAEEFRPERFLQPLRHPAQFIAFSYGPRSCIGYQYAMMSTKTVLATLLRDYKLLPESPETYPFKPLRIKYDIMLKHVDNFRLRIERRK